DRVAVFVAGAAVSDGRHITFGRDARLVHLDAIGPGHHGAVTLGPLPGAEARRRQGQGDGGNPCAVVARAVGRRGVHRSALALGWAIRRAMAAAMLTAKARPANQREGTASGIKGSANSKADRAAASRANRMLQRRRASFRQLSIKRITAPCCCVGPFPTSPPGISEVRSDRTRLL